MKLRILVRTAVVLMLLAVLLTSIGCNTWEGAGKDVERAGEKMQDK